MPVLPIQPLALEHTALSGEQGRARETRVAMDLPVQAAEGIKDQLTLSEGALKLSAETTGARIQAVPGRFAAEKAPQDDAPAGTPARPFDAMA